MGGRDIQEYQFIGAFRGIPGAQFNRISGIPQVNEISTLDRSAVLDIQTGDDSFSQHMLGAAFYKLADTGIVRYGPIQSLLSGILK
jgi:hypothetical protein